MATDDPNYSYLLRRIEELEQLLRANPLRSASVSRGTTEFRENSTLLITDSNLRVIGTAYVVGRLEGEGTFSWSGPALLDGPVEITNTLDVLAATRLRGETTIEGLTRLLAELVVEGKITAGDVRIEDGKVYAGGMVLDPSIAGGALTFPNGSRLEADAANGGERLIAGDAVVNVGDVASLRKGSTSVIISSLGVTVNAPSGEEILLQGAVRIPLASVPTYAGTGLPAGTLRLSTSGRLERADGS